MHHFFPLGRAATETFVVVFLILTLLILILAVDVFVSSLGFFVKVSGATRSTVACFLLSRRKVDVFAVATTIALVVRVVLIARITLGISIVRVHVECVFLLKIFPFQRFTSFEERYFAVPKLLVDGDARVLQTVHHLHAEIHRVFIWQRTPFREKFFTKLAL